MIHTHSSDEHFHLSPVVLCEPPSPHTLRISDRIQEKNITILIDFGSSQNILEPKIGELLALSVVAINPFSVIVVNGESIQFAGYGSNVPMVMTHKVFHIPCYILLIHGANLVFRVHWLQTLGTFLSDYLIPSIQFSYHNQSITLIVSSPTLSTQAFMRSYVDTCLLA
ncbi:hypothetical protein HKD37_13G036639 [Glycine soja]